MCQAKSKGGVRCASCRARSLSGSKATMKTASILTGTESKEVSKVFTELRKEGANLPEPSQEDVMAYARSNKYMAKYGPEIPDNQRNKLVQKWEEAEKETPDGGTFHAWRNTAIQTFKKFRRTFTALGISSAILLTSACGMGGDNNNTPSPSPSVSVSQSATPTPTTTTPVSKDGIVAKSKTPVNNGQGEYLSSTLQESDPVLKLDESKVSAAAKANYSTADLEEANKVAATMIAEDYIDSIANGNSQNVDAWWEKNKDRFDPAYQSVMKQTLDGDSAGVIFRMPNATAGQYNYVYDKNSVRVTSRTITLDSANYINEAGTTGITLKYNVSWSMPVVTADGSKGSQTNSGFVQYGLIKRDDGWKIAGSSTQIRTEVVPSTK